MSRRVGNAIILCQVLGICSALAQDSSGYSSSRLTSLKPNKPANEECVNFEATFSEPLKENPSVTLDIEKQHLIDGVISFLLKVTPFGPKKYRFSLMENSQDKKCAIVKQPPGDFSVTVEGSKGSDGRPLLPDQKSFNYKTISNQ